MEKMWTYAGFLRLVKVAPKDGKYIFLSKPMPNKVKCIHSTGKGREVDFFLIVPVYYQSKRVGQVCRNDFFRQAHGLRTHKV